MENTTPAYTHEQAYGHFHRAVRDYERAVREQYGVATARTYMIEAAQVWEQMLEGHPEPETRDSW